MAEEKIKKEEVTEEAVEKTEASVKATPKPRRKKSKRSVPAGQVHIKATFNNTVVTITDPQGATITSSSAGAAGFRGSKKGTAYAAQVAIEKAASQAKNQHGLTKVDVFVKGIGLGRDSAVRSLGNLELQVETLTDVTSIAHGGVRPKKARRV